jgi:hypothetical protein
MTSFSIMTFILMTLSIKGLFTTHSINETEHNNTVIMLSVVLLSVEFSYCCAECHRADCSDTECYAECHYAE